MFVILILTIQRTSDGFLETLLLIVKSLQDPVLLTLYLMRDVEEHVLSHPPPPFFRPDQEQLKKDSKKLYLSKL